MKVRKFRPGDRVQKKGNGQIMIVLKYLNDRDIECAWYEPGKRIKELLTRGHWSRFLQVGE